MAGFDILNVIGDDWNDSESLFGGIKVSITDIASYPTSRFLEFVLNGNPIFRVLKTGETVISNASGSSIGGIGMRGNSGEMALTSQISPHTGIPADVFRWAWENGVVGNASVLRGMGSNRLSLESNGIITQISANSRFEFEGYISQRVIFVGFEAASAIGKTIDFNNYGQTPTRANPVVSISVQDPTDDALHIGTFDGRDWVTKARFTGEGLLHNSRGFICTVEGEANPKFQLGLDTVNRPFIGMGPGGDTFYDATFRRAGPNMFSIGGMTTNFPALKRADSWLQIRVANDSDFTHIQGKLTTDTFAVAETITPDSTLTLYDAAGVAYKVPCIAA
ncbi:hypothetical protein P1X14_09390 [Sphingomonas sp. AOB5]|uniref:hypothetical protein n=1 Tax=Sphingomonas sp. AOB5 TaxID=3034017 RepID=UPI0023F92ECD|nr:hypothetical protein [Sphingomonas sp. AOB5]MDF7775460.1 hypothetical protein [Sphingomonas sp. AOB5]